MKKIKNKKAVIALWSIGAIILLGVATAFILVPLFNFLRTDYLPKNYRDYIPYSPGLTYVYKSNSGEVDTASYLEETKRIEGTNNDPLDPFPEIKRRERFRLRMLTTNHNYPEQQLETRAISMSGDSMTIRYSGKAGIISAPGWISLEEFDNMETVQLQIMGEDLDDVLIFESTSRFPEKEHHIQRLYWSKGYGAVRVDKNAGEFWELVEVINQE